MTRRTVRREIHPERHRRRIGHIWSIGTRKEEVSPEEVRRRFEELMATQSKA